MLVSRTKEITIKTSALPKLAEELNGLIRKGNASKARRHLEAVTKEKLPRKFACEFASFARRAEDATLALKILNPIVRPRTKSPQEPTELEKAEYAACLSKVGASDEALALLKGLDHSLPEVMLYQSFTHMARWEYAETIPLLRKYLDLRSLDDYSRCVAQVNLAASLIYEHHHNEASTLLEELLRTTEPQGHFLLFGNSLQLQAQNEIVQAKWEEADLTLQRAQETLSKTGKRFEMLVRKWKAIKEVIVTKGSESSLKELSAVRAEAERLHHWETLRSCDRYQAIATHDERLLSYLYFGCPFTGFKSRVLSDYGPHGELPSHYSWKLGPKGKGLILDLRTGKIEGSKESLRLGKTHHRALVTLSSDFYRPFRLASLYAKIYPDEYFNPESSPLRVHLVMNRLRTWIEESKLPLIIAEEQGNYRLEANEACEVIVGNSAPASAQERTLQNLKGEFPQGTHFTLTQAETYLKTSYSSTLRVLSAAMETGILQKEGKGKKTRYFFKV